MRISRIGTTPRRILMASLCLAGNATLSPATTILYELQYIPTSLPSAQGWVYNEDGAGGIPEADVFRIENDQLIVDTFGIDHDYNCYEHELPYLPSVTRISASFSVRIIESEPQDDSHALNLYLNFGPAEGPSRCPFISVSATTVAIIMGTIVQIPVVATEWHEYTIESDILSGQCELYIDGDLMYWWPSPSWTVTSIASFGDRIRPYNVRAEIASVSVQLLGEGGVAVESRSWSGVKSLFAE